MIRNVSLSDALFIADIYNYYIENTIITFDKEKRSLDDVRHWIKSTEEKKYPFVVYEKNNKVVGYACLSQFRSKSAYDITLETSVYVDKSCCGQGIGKLLYGELIKQAKILHLHSLIGVISIPNESSRKLHEYYNFKHVGIVKEAGKKFNKWIDIEFWQLIL